MRLIGRWDCLLGLLLICIGVVFAGRAPVHAQEATGAVLVVPIRGTIDLGLAPYLERVLEEARRTNAPLVMLEIDTPGGRLDAALQMRAALLDAATPTAAFVNTEAFSAGALIALAANEIYMAPGAVMGAATPVDQRGIPADEKTISAVRSTFRSTAEARGRDPAIAAAMVDPAIALDGVVAEGELLALTAEEARELGYADGIVTSRQEVLAATGLAGAPLQETTPRLAENVVRFLTHPVVASLLTGLGFLFILADVLSGGFGLVGLIGIGMYALFFWGHALAGLAGWESVALVVIGLVFLGVELFVTPGFGVAGVLGIVVLLGGLFVALIGGPIVTPEALARAGYTLVGTVVFVVLGLVAMVRYLPRFGRLQGLILQTQVGSTSAPAPRRRRWSWLEGPRMEAHTQPSVEEPPSLEGARGVALSDLHPGGIARIAGERVDVVSQGEYISAGEPIVVIADQGYRRVVRRVEPDDNQSADSDVQPADAC